MVKAVVDHVVIVRPWQTWLRTVGIGAGVGLIFWVLTVMLNRYVLDPLFCRQMADVAMCLDLTEIAGNVAHIFTGLIGLAVLVRLRTRQPLLIVVATVALLWDFAGWTVGLPTSGVVVASIILYALSYGLFAWVAQHAKPWVVLVLGLVIVLGIRTALLLLTL